MLQISFRTLSLMIAGIMLFWISPVKAQNIAIPQNTFSIYTGDSVIIEKGTATKVDIWALRSKSFSKKKIRMRLASSLPDGVVVSFLPTKGYFDYCQATISANPSAKEGTYNIIISGSMQHLTKGSILKLIVLEPQESAR